MNQTKTSCELKMIAKEQLLGNYGKMICALLVAELIPSFIMFLAEDFAAKGTLINLLLYYMVNFIVALLIGVFTLGTTKLYMNFSTGRPFATSDIFYGFHGHQNTGILIALVQAGIAFVSLIPFIISIVFWYLTKSAFLYPVIALTIIAGVVFAYVLLLTISQSFYIAVDFPDYTIKQILSMSRRIMKGHRARLFYIHVSFIPLALLTLLSFGIGLLWLQPYMNNTLTHFYLDLMDFHTKSYQAN